MNPSTPLPPTDYLALVVVVFLAGFTAVIILTFLLHFFQRIGVQVYRTRSADPQSQYSRCKNSMFHHVLTPHTIVYLCTT